jgi:hypothetical protein
MIAYLVTNELKRLWREEQLWQNVRYSYAFATSNLIQDWNLELVE